MRLKGTLLGKSLEAEITFELWSFSTFISGMADEITLILVHAETLAALEVT